MYDEIDHQSLADWICALLTSCPLTCCLARDPKVRKSVERIFTIWEERNVYPEELITQLKANLAKKEREREKEKAKETPPPPGQSPMLLFLSLLCHHLFLLPSLSISVTSGSVWVNRSVCCSCAVVLSCSPSQPQSCPEVQDCGWFHSKCILFCPLLNCFYLFKAVICSCYIHFCFW